MWLVPTIDSTVVMKHGAIDCGATAERALAMSVLQLPETIEAATDLLQPHIVCDQMHTIAQVRRVTHPVSCVGTYIQRRRIPSHNAATPLLCVWLG